MTEPTLWADGVDLLKVRGLYLVETAAPRVSSEHRVAMDRVWDAVVRATPSLFDGPAVACMRVKRGDGGGLVLSWARVTYRQFALRWVPGAVGLPSLFVAVVQATDEGDVLVGRMSVSTAAPGRLQLPGGSVEPPAAHNALDERALREHAARELVEETGVGVAPAELTLWGVTCGEHGNIGVFFHAPAQPEAVIRDRFAALVSAEAAAGRVPELREITFVRSGADLAELGGPQVDYLAPIIRQL